MPDPSNPAAPVTRINRLAADRGQSAVLIEALIQFVSDELRAAFAAYLGVGSAGAQLDSPAFTGTPTAPTPDTILSNTQLATTAFVHNAIASLVNSAPGALDTLRELADALGDDAHFATTVTNSLAALTSALAAKADDEAVQTLINNLTAALALKAPLADPAFTGAPTAPTPAPGDNTTNVATTEFVTVAIAALASTFPANPLNDAPDDGSQYCRQGGQWMQVQTSSGLEDAPSDGNLYARYNGTWDAFNPLTDAPSDGNQYCRQNGGWEVIANANPFNQSLNSTDSPTFAALTVAGAITFTAFAVYGADSGWSANADAGDKTASVPAIPDLSALDAQSPGFAAWAQGMDKKFKALENVLMNGRFPNA
jgi:hypothetical protein